MVQVCSQMFFFLNLLSYLAFSQIWLNFLVHHHHFGYNIKKTLKIMILSYCGTHIYLIFNFCIYIIKILLTICLFVCLWKGMYMERDTHDMPFHKNKNQIQTFSFFSCKGGSVFFLARNITQTNTSFIL
jgi:hypothetical protein